MGGLWLPLAFGCVLPWRYRHCHAHAPCVLRVYRNLDSFMACVRTCLSQPAKRCLHACMHAMHRGLRSCGSVHVQFRLTPALRMYSINAHI